MKKAYVLLLLFCVNIVVAQKSVYQIGILLDVELREDTPFIEMLQHQIKQVVGEDAEIKFPENSILVNRLNQEKAIQHYQLLLNNDTDIILAFGPVNQKVITAQKIHKKPTILFGALNKDFSAIDFSKKSSGIQNFTYLVESESYLEDLKKFKELTNYKHLGIVIEEKFMELLPVKSLFDQEFKELEANYKLIPFTSVSDITNNLDGVDAVYIAGGFFLTEEEVQQLANTLIEKRLPSFTIEGVHQVRKGIMATNQSEENFEQFLRRIAITVEGYINGTDLAEMPVYIEYHPRLTLNFNTAHEVGVPIKYSLINQTDFVGEMKNLRSEKRYNLLDVIQQAMDKNLGLQANQRGVALSEQELKLAKTNYLPSVTAAANGVYTDPKLAEISGGQNPEFQTAGNITLKQTVFSEAANANIEIQRNLLKAQEANFDAEQLNTILDAANAYFNALILKANLQIQVGNLDLTKRNLEIAQQNYEAGESGKSDLLRFRSQLAQHTQAMVEAINRLELSFVQLNQILNNAIDAEIDIEDVVLDEGILERYNYDKFMELLDDPSLREPFIAFLTQEALKNAPELSALGYNLKATERNIKLNSSGRFLPTFALQGQYNHVFDRSGKGSTLPQGASFLDSNYNVALSVSIPILNSNKTNINRKTALIQKEQINYNKENTELAIAANIRNAVLSIVNQVSNIELSGISEATAKEALELTQTSYNNGAVNIVQLIDAQNNYMSTQQARTNAVYNYLMSVLQLERFLGSYFLLNSEADNAKFNQRFLEFLNTQN